MQRKLRLLISEYIFQIIHLDTVAAKRVEPKYNLRNVGFELSIRQSTEITEKGWYEEDVCGKDETVETEWKNIGEMEGIKISKLINIEINRNE